MTGYTEIQLLQQDRSAVPPYSQCNNSPQKSKEKWTCGIYLEGTSQEKKKQNKKKPTSLTLTNQYLELRKKKQKFKSTRR